MKRVREILGEQVRAYRKGKGRSVIWLAEKADVSRQSIYDIEAGEQNLRADVFEALITACGFSPEQWERGEGLDVKPKDRRQQQLHALLQIILNSQDEELIRSVQIVLDSVSDRALQQKSRDEPRPDQGRETDLKAGNRPGKPSSRKKVV